MMARLVTSSVLLDMRPLQGPSAGRGVGSYARGLLGGLIAEGFDSRLILLLDSGLDEPSLPSGRYRLAGSRRRYHGQLEAATREELPQQLLGALFQKGNVAGLDLSDLRGVDVVDADLVATVGKGQRERQPDVAAAADDDQV